MLQNIASGQVIPHVGLVATIRRDHVFEDSLQLMSDLPSLDLKNKLRISFIDALGQAEAGIDGGGLFKDFIENLLKVWVLIMRICSESFLCTMVMPFQHASVRSPVLSRPSHTLRKN